MRKYADHYSPYEYSVSVDDVIFKLENDARFLMEWYTNNYLSPNPDKWHLLLSGQGNELFVTIGQRSNCNSSTEKILGVVFDNKLNFNCHLDKLCKKAGQKIHALARVSNFMSHKQRKVIMNAFISSQFNYCPLWMLHSRPINLKINKIHHRALSIAYRDNNSSFESLLEKSGSVTIHHRNWQLSAVEIFKAHNNLSPSIMSELFEIKEMKYEICNEMNLRLNLPRTSTYGIDSLSYLSANIWTHVSLEIK